MSDNFMKMLRAVAREGGEASQAPLGTAVVSFWLVDSRLKWKSLGIQKCPGVQTETPRKKALLSSAKKQEGCSL